jgi:hypothetical protein
MGQPGPARPADNKKTRPLSAGDFRGSRVGVVGRADAARRCAGRPECRDHGPASDHGASRGRARAWNAVIKGQFLITEHHAGDRAFRSAGRHLKRIDMDPGRQASQLRDRQTGPILSAWHGASVACRTISRVQHALVAQRIEHLTTDQKVGGSSPSERATFPAGQGHIGGHCQWPGYGPTRSSVPIRTRARDHGVPPRSVVGYRRSSRTRRLP